MVTLNRGIGAQRDPRLFEDFIMNKQETIDQITAALEALDTLTYVDENPALAALAREMLDRLEQDFLRPLTPEDYPAV